MNLDVSVVKKENFYQVDKRSFRELLTIHKRLTLFFLVRLFDQGKHSIKKIITPLFHRLIFFFISVFRESTFEESIFRKRIDFYPNIDLSRFELFGLLVYSYFYSRYLNHSNKISFEEIKNGDFFFPLSFIKDQGRDYFDKNSNDLLVDYFFNNHYILPNCNFFPSKNLSQDSIDNLSFIILNIPKVKMIDIYIFEFFSTFFSIFFTFVLSYLFNFFLFLVFKYWNSNATLHRDFQNYSFSLLTFFSIFFKRYVSAFFLSFVFERFLNSSFTTLVIILGSAISQLFPSKFLFFSLLVNSFVILVPFLVIYRSYKKNKNLD